MDPVSKDVFILKQMISCKKLECKVEREKYHVRDTNENLDLEQEQSITTWSELEELQLSESVWSDSLMMC